MSPHIGIVGVQKANMDKQKFPIQVELVTFNRRIAKQIQIDFEYWFHAKQEDGIIGWIGREAIENSSREFVLANHANGDYFLIASSHTEVEKYFNIKLPQIFLV